MKIISIAGNIGVGKSSLTHLISEEFGGLAKYETIPPILSRWYGDDADVQANERIPFLTQLTFLTQRMEMIRDCLSDERQGFAICDRTIYEDYLFAYLTHKFRGTISESEFAVYTNLLHVMTREINSMEQKAPHVTFYIRTTFEKSLERIIKRGRKEEVDNLEKNYDWFKLLHSHYDDYMFGKYLEQTNGISPIVVIDGDKYDFINNVSDREDVMKLVHDALVDNGVITEEKEGK